MLGKWLSNWGWSLGLHCKRCHLLFSQLRFSTSFSCFKNDCYRRDLSHRGKPGREVSVTIQAYPGNIHITLWERLFLAINQTEEARQLGKNKRKKL